MSDTDFPRHSFHESNHSRLANRSSVDELVEISLNSDTEQANSEILRHPHLQSPFEREPVFSPENTTLSYTSFFESDQTNSSSKSASVEVFSEIAIQDLDSDDGDEDLNFNMDLADEMRRQCTLLSPSLVRAIASDIQEIKRSLSSANTPPATTSNLRNLLTNNQPMAAQPVKRHVSQPDELEMLFNGKRASGCKRRLPQSRPSIFRRKNWSHPTKATMIKSNRDQKDKGLTTQQWVFPAAANTVYSSSDNSDDECAGDNNPTEVALRLPIVPQSQLKEGNGSGGDDGGAVKVETHDGEWSLQKGPPLALAATPSRHVPSQKSAEGTSVRILPTKAKMNASVREIDYDSDEDTDQLLDKQYRSEKPVEIPELKEEAEYLSVKSSRGKEVSVRHPDFHDRLIEGRLYPSRYLGSTQLLCDGHPSKINRLRQAQEAVNRIKAPAGESQPSVAVDIFVSMERILILNKGLDEIVMDHDLRQVSYIADIGNILVLMIRRRPSPSPPTVTSEDNTNQSPPTLSPAGASPNPNPTDSSSGCQSDACAETNGAKHGALLTQLPPPPSKVICHLFESDQVQAIAQAIGKAFHEAYLQYLRDNGVEDPETFQERNYQEILNSQEIFRNDLALFSDKEQEKEVIIPKQKGEALGVVVVESGWGSVLPTVVLANMNPTGPAARCGQLNIGNQIISINGQSLVGLPLASSQALIKATKTQTAVKFIIVNCPPVVEALIRRPDLKFQLGFSVQDGVICSLLRGGIAERGGIRVDHRIIEINGESVVAVPHELIVHLLATAVGEIYIRTMPTSIFRLLTGQDIPHYI